MTVTTGFKRTSIFAATIVLSSATTAANAACSDPAAPKVDWTGCVKTGSDLGNADLSGAKLTGAVLDTVTWKDGKTCAEDSIDLCK